MAQSSLLQLARTGDADAIAALMNITLQAIGISARTAIQGNQLHILLESDRTLAPFPSVEFVRQGLARLRVGGLSSAVIYARLVGQQTPEWVQAVNLAAAASNPFVLETEAALKVGRSPKASLGQPTKLMHPLVLGLPLALAMSSGYIWNRYLVSGTAQNKAFAPSSNLRSTAPKIQADSLSLAFQRATEAVAVGKTASSQSEWRQAANLWQVAIAHLRSLPADHPKATLAQKKVAEYQNYLTQIARSKLASTTGMSLIKTITGAISPKSIVYSGQDLFFAQNMMYKHTITVYDRQFNLVKTISDQVSLVDYGYSKFSGTQQGSPVEAAFSPDGETAWVSNYQMYGTEFSGKADDDCSPSSNLDPSFLYRINTRTLTIDQAVQVGAVPKFVATLPNNRYVLTSNWCSWDVSVVDPQQNKEVRRIELGAYPRGIAVDAKSETAYVAVMGSYDIAAIDLASFKVRWLRGIGRSPRHLNIDPAGRFLYATLNGEGKVTKIDLSTSEVISKISTGSAPRSMTITPDGQFLYVVNYESDTVSKVRTDDMAVMQTVNVCAAPIGITYDPVTYQVWVACYSGSIQVFQD
jgi:YVTN family beta-propeller protein